ncbi:imelysin family protein [Azospirillum halopraeferens]|uniref:imelysin family protein n=1 Tax=Azospirillum halopraeferens TaxID=34010 RepID=UPI0005558DDA|nr:imelysin family protein [Azospirillum halopraeferens]
MRRRTVLTLAAGAAATALVPVARAAAPSDTAFLDRLLRSHIQPRLDRLAAAATDLAQRLERFCAAPDAAGFEAARAGYHGAMDAWAGAQHLRPGPLLLEMRGDRIAFWPERRGIVARQLAAVLAARDPGVTEPGAVRKQSAAVQGLTALERLLFDDGVGLSAFTDGEAGRYRCALAAAVGANVAALAGEVRDDWTALTPRLLAGEATSVGATPRAAVENLYASLVTMAQIVADQKLRFPLGDGPGDARPTLAEAMRSGRTLRSIALNLEAMSAMVLGENGGPGYAVLLPDTAEGTAARTAAVNAFAAARAAAAAAPGPFAEAIADPGRRPGVEAVLRATRSVQTVLVQTFPPLIGVALGFNELDGD